MEKEGANLNNFCKIVFYQTLLAKDKYNKTTITVQFTLIGRFVLHRSPGNGCDYFVWTQVLYKYIRDSKHFFCKRKKLKNEQNRKSDMNL